MCEWRQKQKHYRTKCEEREKNHHGFHEWKIIFYLHFFQWPRRKERKVSTPTMKLDCIVKRRNWSSACSVKQGKCHQLQSSKNECHERILRKRQEKKASWWVDGLELGCSFQSFLSSTAGKSLHKRSVALSINRFLLCVRVFSVAAARVTNCSAR